MEQCSYQEVDIDTSRDIHQNSTVLHVDNAFLVTKSGDAFKLSEMYVVFFGELTH